MPKTEGKSLCTEYVVLVMAEGGEEFICWMVATWRKLGRIYVTRKRYIHLSPSHANCLLRSRARRERSIVRTQCSLTQQLRPLHGSEYKCVKSGAAAIAASESIGSTCDGQATATGPLLEGCYSDAPRSCTCALAASADTSAKLQSP